MSLVQDAKIVLETVLNFIPEQQVTEPDKSTTKDASINGMLSLWNSLAKVTSFSMIYFHS